MGGRTYNPCSISYGRATMIQLWEKLAAIWPCSCKETYLKSLPYLKSHRGCSVRSTIAKKQANARYTAQLMLKSNKAKICSGMYSAL